MRLGPGFFALFKRVLWPRLWPRIIVLAGVTLAYITYAGAHLVPLALWGVNTSAAQTNLRSVAMTCHSARCGPVSNGQRYWRVTRDFTFATESGRQIRSQVIQRMASPPTAGLVSQRQVIYLPRNPARHVIGGRPALMQQLALSALALTAMLALLGYHVAVSARRARAGLRLLANGGRRMVPVTVSPTGARVVSWVLPDGRTGTSLPRAQDVALPAYGSQIEILDDGQASWGVNDLHP